MPFVECLHTKVTEYVKKRISSGEYRVGSKIPTEEELSKELRVSRPTVSKALETLVRDGFLKRIRGKGSFVTKPKLVHESTGFITSYRAESEKKGSRCAQRSFVLR